MFAGRGLVRQHFYPRPPRGGRPQPDAAHRVHRPISIHALREEGDADEKILTNAQEDISIHALREEGDSRSPRPAFRISISIHALREEGDCSATLRPSWCSDFYPRPPRGGRLLRGELEPIGFLFLSTPSARRATNTMEVVIQKQIISIHALREEGDGWPLPSRTTNPTFLSTPSARRATQPRRPGISRGAFLSTPSARRATCEKAKNSSWCCHFYPRPPRGGRPIPCPAGMPGMRHFYPRPPRGGRPGQIGHGIFVLSFLSTPSARRATREAETWARSINISIHALREEGDLLIVFPLFQTFIFLSTPSARRAT